jgi:glucoamylase
VSKSFVYGNGSILVGLDNFGQVYDLYFPYVGMENHTGGSYVHKIGVWSDGKFHWTDDGSWEITTQYYENAKIKSKLFLKNNDIGITLEFNDEVYNELNVFMREVIVHNDWNEDREVKLYFNQQFEIYESHRGDTAYYEPENNVVIHYKGRRIFLVNAFNREEKKSFDEYSIGLFGIEGKQGTFKDAEDGKLEKNPIEHGLTDSVIGINVSLKKQSSCVVDYWLAIGKELDDVYALNNYMLKKGLTYLITTTTNYWRAWTEKKTYDFRDLSEQEEALFKNSLKVIKAHTDSNGAIIASSDTDLLKYGRDAYSYVWPRDSAFTSMAYSRAGYDDINKSIFSFFNDTITRQGYFMHKYRSDKSIGSSWHPWIYQGKQELPIQLDETALVVYAVWEDFKYSKDVEFIEKIYNSLVKKSIEFVISRIDTDTGLVRPSYDLWEEHYGTFTFTSSAVYGALIAASSLAETFGKYDKCEEYQLLAKLVKHGILEYLYNDEKKIFNKRILEKEYGVTGEDLIDETIDVSSLYGIFRFNVLDVDDEKVKNMQENVLNNLSCETPTGGIPRYEYDNYFRATDTVKGNPWIITTMWMAQLEIAQSKTLDDLKQAKRHLDWANKHATSSGLLSEQLNPMNGIGLSAGPLTWSHAEYVVTVLDYLQKYEELTEQELRDKNW